MKEYENNEDYQNNGAPEASGAQNNENPFSIFTKSNMSKIFDWGNKINDDIKGINEKFPKININNEKPKKKKLIPRDYQKQIFEKAKNQNSIIFVETGKGKTFISIMLMADLLGINIDNDDDEKPKYDKNKKIIFLVCDTALVEQQRKQIQKILNIEVGTIQGKKDKKSKNDYDSFISKWNSLSIFVGIPSIIYKLLSCGFINIFQISMLIFDECHHTADDHPYNQIMREFYFFYKKIKELDHYKYPRIYGLTASPMKSGIKNNSLEVAAYEAMQKLSENLDCVIVIDPEMINSNAKEMRPGENIDQYLNDDTYIEVQYHTEIKEYKTIITTLHNECFLNILEIGFSDVNRKKPELSIEYYEEQYTKYLKEKFKTNNLEDYNKICQIFDFLYNLKNISPFFHIFEKIQRHIFMILENLCLDSLIFYFEALIGNYTSIYQKKIDENNLSIKSSNSSINFSETEEDEDDETDILSLEPESIEEMKNIFSDIMEKLKEIRKSKDYISDRLKKLFIKINNLFESNSKSKFIIFIANRIVAHFLKPALSSYLKKYHKNKKCDEIIGINKQKSGGGTTLTPSLTLKRLNEIISNFNEDKFDILIGTSAIEEGLDIQSCNAVLALVELNTPKSFIQIKGRARKSNSHFYIFTNSAAKAKLKIKNFISVGEKMKDLFEGKICKDFRTKDFIYRKPDFYFEFDENSHAKITMGNVSIFFNEIKQQIESNGIKFKSNIEIKKVKSTKPSQEFEFVGTINIETDLYIKSEFPKSSDRQNSKENATKVCQLYALLYLKKYKYLDSHLKFCIKGMK